MNLGRILRSRPIKNMRFFASKGLYAFRRERPGLFHFAKNHPKPMKEEGEPEKGHHRCDLHAAATRLYLVALPSRAETSLTRPAGRVWGRLTPISDK